MLYPSHQNQNDHDDQNNAKPAAGIITLAAGIPHVGKAPISSSIKIIISIVPITFSSALPKSKIRMRIRLAKFRRSLVFQGAECIRRRRPVRNCTVAFSIEERRKVASSCSTEFARARRRMGSSPSRASASFASSAAHSKRTFWSLC